MRITLLSLCLASCLVASAQKITLTPANLINLSARADAGLLIDEQAKAGDPVAGTGGTPTTQFTNGFIDQALIYPLEIIIDLFGEYNISKFSYYDANGSDSLFVGIGTPGAWRKIVHVTTTKYNAWANVDVNQKSRYLYLKFRSPNTLINEIVVYGSPTGPILPPPAPVSNIEMPKPLMEDFIGMNSFVDVPDSIHAVVKQVREYHNWFWDEGNGATTYPGFPNNQYAWSPSWVSGTGWGWDFDAFYQRNLKKGIQVAPDLQMNVGYLMAKGGEPNDKPASQGENTTDPATYKEHADYMYQFAARYGYTPVPTTNLKLRSTNGGKTGLKYIKYVENWNEPDKNWEGKAGYFTPAELSAMCSADYDGHQGALGKTYGVKNADPTIKMVLPALIHPDSMYMKSMIAWAKYNRNGSLPFDVFNFHYYSNDAGGQGGSPATHGISPEEDKMKEKIQKVVKFRNKNMPGKEIWCTEFGYDTQPSSPQSSRAVGTQDAWEVQARWLIRSYLALAASGIDKAHMYMVRDANESGLLFATSGLTTPNSNLTYKAYTKKKSWYYLHTFRKTLTGYKFKEEINSGNTNVLIYAFENAIDPSKVVYAVWAPTSIDQTVKSYTLSLPSNITSLSKVELLNKDTTAKAVPVAYSNKTVAISVDEKPDLYLIKSTGTVLDIEEEVVYSSPESFTVYPNPFSSLLNIAINSKETLSSVAIRDIRGTVIKTFNADDLSQSLNVEDLAKGVYVLEGRTNSKIYTYKIIKN